MLNTFLKTWLTVACAYPGLVAILYGLLQAGKDTKFDEADPEHHQNLVDFINLLLSVLVEHWLLWLIVSAGIAYLWSVLLANPKARSKAKFVRKAVERLPAKGDRDD